MIKLIEELKTGETIFILLDTVENFLYGEYIVGETTNNTMKHQSATLNLINKPKKERYFKKKIVLKGFHINFDYTQKEYKVFDCLDDLIKYFCKNLNKNKNKNPKLFKKFKNKYPSYFYSSLSYQ
jgi:hypothetical protein